MKYTDGALAAAVALFAAKHHSVPVDVEDLIGDVDPILVIGALVAVGEILPDPQTGDGRYTHALQVVGETFAEAANRHEL